MHLEKFAEGAKEREERFLALVESIKQDNMEFKKDIKDEVSNLKGEMSSLKNEFNMTKQDISELTKHNESLATTNKWSNIATIIGISTIVITAIVAFITFLISL